MYLRTAILLVLFCLLAQQMVFSKGHVLTGDKKDYEHFLKDYKGEKIELVTVEDSIYTARLADIKKDVLILELKPTKYIRLNIADIKELKLYGGKSGSVIKHSLVLLGAGVIALMALFAYSGT